MLLEVPGRDLIHCPFGSGSADDRVAIRAVRSGLFSVPGGTLELLGLGEVRVSAVEIVVTVALDRRGQLEPGWAVLEG